MMAGMSPLPSALLSKFYERDSLRNTDTGFELRFKNRLAPSTIVGIGPLTLDGHVYEATIWFLLLSELLKDTATDRCGVSSR